jgi:hypothetical protein
MTEHHRQRTGRGTWVRRAGLALVWLALLALLAAATMVAVAVSLRLAGVGLLRRVLTEARAAAGTRPTGSPATGSAPQGVPAHRPGSAPNRSFRARS